MSLDIQFKIYSTIEDLEDEFLGQEIAPNVFVERIFYEAEYKQNSKEPEPILQERSRIKERGNYDYTEDLHYEFDFTSLNYVEFDSANWNHLVYGYHQWFSEKEMPKCLKRIDDYIGQSDLDFQTKQFSLTKLLNRAKSSVTKLQQIRKQEYINESQKDLLDVFIQIYDLLAQNIQSQKYTAFLKVKESEPIFEPKEIINSNNGIEDTVYYKMLYEVEFIEIIETYPNPQRIIATLGRSKDFRGYVFSIQKEYYAFCDKIKLIKCLEKQFLYDAGQIGKFLAKLSSFDTQSTSNNFKRYYEARNNPDNKKHYASNDKNIEKIQFVLTELSKK